MRAALCLLLIGWPALCRAQSPSLTLVAQAGTQVTVESGVTLDSPPNGATEWFARSDVRWLTVEPRTGVTPTRVIVRADPAGLPAGDRSATLRFVDDAGVEMLVVPVTLRLVGRTPPVAEPGGTTAGARPPVRASSSSTAAVDAGATGRAGPAPPRAPTGGEAPPLTIGAEPLPVVIRNLPYAQPVPIAGGTPPYEVRLIGGRLPPGLVMTNGVVTGTTRVPGQYAVHLRISDASAPAQVITQVVPLRVLVLQQGAVLSVSTPDLAFTGSAGTRSTAARVGVASGSHPLPWTARTAEAWLVITPGAGMAPGQFVVEIDATGLRAGRYAGLITVAMDGVPNSPLRIPVSLTLR